MLSNEILLTKENFIRNAKGLMAILTYMKVLSSLILEYKTNVSR